MIHNIRSQSSYHINKLFNTLQGNLTYFMKTYNLLRCAAYLDFYIDFYPKLISFYTSCDLLYPLRNNTIILFYILYIRYRHICYNI